MANSYYFTRKIECIYKNIANSSLTQLTKLFITKDKYNDKTYLEYRKTHISRKWLKNSNANFSPKSFKSDFEQYPFYNTITIDSKPLFQNATDFLETPLNEFCEKIYEYVNYKNTQHIDNNSYIFNYFYIHHINYNNQVSNNIKEYKIIYKERLSANSFSIKVTNNSTDNNFEYTGKITYKKSKLILQLENNWNYSIILSNLEFVNRKPDYLVGVISGFSELNEKIPRAKKVVLTKDKVEDFNSLYLTLNETEMIYAEENIYRYNLNSSDYYKNHFNKYANKLDKLDSFFTNCTKSGIFASAYYQLAFRELNSLNTVFKNIKEGSSYYVKNRYNILNSISKAYEYEKYSNFYMITPIYSNYFMFNHFSPEITTILSSLQRLSERGVKIEIIFVINSCNRKVTPEFLEHLEILSKFATIYFVQKEHTEGKVASVDFFFTEDKNLTSNYIIYKPLHMYHQIFVFSKENYIVEQFKTTYKKIRHYSAKYKAPLNMQDYCKTYANSINKLVGDWYLYVYGSKQLWKFNIKIYNNNSVEFFYNDKISDRGIIINNQYQSIIMVEDVSSKMTTTYMLDNNLQEINHAFLVKAIAKQYKKSSDMFTLGICSKEPMDKDDIEYILGNEKEQILLIDDSIKARLSNYIFEKFEKPTERP